MFDSLRANVRRARRSVAQRGLRNLMYNVWRRFARGSHSAHWNPPLRSSSESPPLPRTHPFDQRFGVDTSGSLNWQQLETGHAHDLYTVNYYGVAPSLFDQAMDRWQASRIEIPFSEITFVDLGCGKGRAVLLASRLPFKAVIGVELNPGLSEICRDNIQLWQRAARSTSPMHSICQDASEFVFPDNPCLVYLFNPFTAQVLRKVIANIARSFSTRPGELEVIYINAEFGAEFDRHPGFERLWEDRLLMSPEDAADDLAHQLATTGEAHGDIPSRGEPCGAWRWKGLRD